MSPTVSSENLDGCSECRSAVVCTRCGFDGYFFLFFYSEGIENFGSCWSRFQIPAAVVRSVF
uniref:Uncharacterized protein n=1 Tax=Kalanchoe fedtschenkoi TaxID=63787 RepID=A0A7N0T8E3_KALFE